MEPSSPGIVYLYYVPGRNKTFINIILNRCKFREAKIVWDSHSLLLNRMKDVHVLILSKGKKHFKELVTIEFMELNNTIQIQI